MRYYDTVMATASDIIKRGGRFDERLQEAHVIVVDNVADYYHRGTDQETWDYEDDFPNVAPAFANMWMEWRAPSYQLSKVTGMTKIPYEGAASWMYSSRTDDGSWQVAAALWLVALGTLDMKKPVCMIQWRVSHDGRWRTEEWEEGGSGRFKFRPTDELMEIAEMGVRHGIAKDMVDAVGQFTAPMLHIIGLALSFMHCKNVNLEDNTPPPRLAKATMRRHKMALHTYKTLHIKPMTQQLASVQQSTGVSWRQALHVCRGHFKDYRSHGLFGKVHGLFWWDAHVRGSREEGIIDKTYNIHPSPDR